jgi:Kef-type K+ transport system membrane component KefB
MFTGSVIWKGIVYTLLMVFGKIATGMVFYVDYFQHRWSTPPVTRTTDASGKSCPATAQQVSENEQRKPPHAQAVLVSFAMVARGEIGFLIASLSQSSGTLSLRQQDGAAHKQVNEDIFLVIVWAVTLCTIIGPVSVGILVRKLKRSGIELSNF